MRLFCKLPLVGMCLVLAGTPLLAKKTDDGRPAATPTEKKGDKGKGRSGKKGDTGKTKDKEKGGDPTAAATPEPGAGRLDLPLVSGHDSFGLKIPYIDENGRLQMTFSIGVASKMDDSHVQMSETQVETYNEEGEPEMSIDLPTSVLDLNTRYIVSDHRTTIKREDFTLTGDSVAFNTVQRVAKLVGNVHMTIYNVTAEKTPATSDPALTPAVLRPGDRVFTPNPALKPAKDLPQ